MAWVCAWPQIALKGPLNGFMAAASLTTCATQCAGSAVGAAVVMAQVCRFLGECVKTHPPDRRVKLNRGGFPLRPDKAPCPSYLKAAFCPLMKACMLHHPNLDIQPRTAADADAGGAEDGEELAGLGQRKKSKTFENERLEVVEEGDWTADYPQNPGQPACEQFLKFGGCECGLPSSVG